MRRRIARWRRWQRSRIVFVPILAYPGSTIVSSGLVAARGVRLIEVWR